MAVSLSTNAVKLYSPLTGQYTGECVGHSATINQTSFGRSPSPHLLYSCSSDSTIRAWDTRCFQQVECLFLYLCGWNAGFWLSPLSLLLFGGAGVLH